VEVRLLGDDAELVVVEREPQPEASELEQEADSDARITLRLSATLKARVEAVSAREGVSVNTWIVRVLGQQARSRGRSWGGSRLTGYGRS
jgi:predicted HicB family RNase H-like nuclease